MDIIGIIVLAIIGLLVLSLVGWGMKILGWIIDLLGEGCSTSWGCLIWIIAIVIAVMVLL
ncbi:MAG: hypothetical protein K6C10_08450 [Prevotella sp.]|nr:hypothetical protein [Prevotella sp.]